MADDIIGSLGVQIEADASDLKGQYDEAVAQSEAAAERIAQAFESLVGIGEALAITEGLKEFGQEALNAYGTVQSVTIGLTQLTKSAAEANDIVEQIKNLAATEPFAFPEIAPTVQRMVALGVSAEQIPATMQAAADASAATGNSFNAVANSIDRIALSGALNARTMTQLGLSMGDVAKAMGVTDDMAKALFKDLDESQRIDILNAALTKFSGSAIAQAQGIKGEWQLFQNQFEEVMVGIGEALAPAAGAILEFGKDALSAMQTAVDAFNKLPGPLKDIGGAIVIAAATLPPLALAVGTVGLGITGLKAIVEPLNGLLATLGLRSTEAATAAGIEADAATTAATAEGERAIATEAAAAASATAGTNAASAGIGLTAMGLAARALGAGITAFIGFEIGKWAVESIPGLDTLAEHVNNLAGHIFPNFTDALNHVREQFGVSTPATRDEAEEIRILQAQLASAGVVLNQYGDDNEHFIQVLRDVRQQIADTEKGSDGYGMALDALLKKHKDLGVELEAANGMLAVAKQRLEEGTISQAQYDEAAKNVLDTQKKLNALNPEYADSLGGITEAYGKQQAAISTLQGTVLTLLSEQDGSASKAALLAAAEDKLAKAYDAHNKAVQQATDTTRAFVGPLTEAEEAANQAAGAMTSYETAAESLVQKQRDFNLSVQTAKGVLDALTASTDTSREHTAATIVGLEQYQTALRNAGQDINTLQTITINGVLYTGKLADIIKTAKDNMADFSVTTATVPQVVETATGRLNGMVIPLGFIATGLTDVVNIITQKAVPAYQTLYDQLSKTPGAFTDLTSKYFDVNQATAAMVNTQDKLNTEFTNAQATVESLQKKLEAGNLTTQQSGDVSRALAAALQTLINVEHQLGTSSGVSTTAIQAQQTQLTGLSSAASSTGLSMDNADRSMQAFTSGLDEKLGSVNAMTLGLWAMSAQLSGLTVFAGSGVDFSKGQMSAIDELSVLQQAEGVKIGASANAAAAAEAAKTQGLIQQLIDAGVAWGDATNVLISLEDKATQTHMSLSKVMSDYISTLGSTSTATTALANATSGNATALGTKTTATTTATAATNSLATATTSLGTAAAAAVDALNSSSITTTDSLGNVTTAYTNAVAGSQTFVDALGNVYSSYQALVAAIQANPLLAGAAQSQSGSGNPGSGPSAAPQAQYKDALGNLYSSYDALQAAIAKNPLLAGAAQSSTNAMPQTLFSDPTGRFGNVTSSGGDTLGSAIAKLFPGGGSGGMGIVSAVAQPTPGWSGGTSFGSSPLGSQTTPITINMNYPQFANPAAAQKTMADIVTMLRTVPSLKL